MIFFGELKNGGAGGLRLEIQKWEGGDYRFRIITNRKEFLSAMASLAVFLDYPNFKARIAELPDQREKLSAFHTIWQLLAQLQREDDTQVVPPQVVPPREAD